jgi:flagellar hook assembly protein FlgD
MFLDVDDEAVLPTEYSISNAYPNPFNPVTNIDITIPESGLMQFAIYDILGRQVFEHKQTFANPGHYRFSWSGKNNHGSSLSSGVYLLTVRFEENYYKQKITLLK